MAADNTLQLVIQVDADKANASIKSVNTGLSSIETTAVSAARGASHGIDGMTASMAKGAVAGNLLAEAIKSAVETAKSWTLEAVQYAAHTSRMTVVMQQLARGTPRPILVGCWLAAPGSAHNFRVRRQPTTIQNRVL